MLLRSLVFGDDEAANQGFDFDLTPNEFMAAPSSIEAACAKFAASLTTLIHDSGLPAEKVLAQLPLLNTPAPTPASAASSAGPVPANEEAHAFDMDLDLAFLAGDDEPAYVSLLAIPAFLSVWNACHVVDIFRRSL